MATNTHALIRYKTIDSCLRNRDRRWTLKDLIDACSEELYRYEGVDKGVSKRTVQMDIQHMRDDVSGYNAPIVVAEKKYYSYEDPDYSIINMPVTDQDSGKLTEVLEVLNQFKDFTYFKQVNGIVQQLEEAIDALNNGQKSSPESTEAENHPAEISPIAQPDESTAPSIDQQRLKALDLKLYKRGSYIFPCIYSPKSLQKIKALVHNYLTEQAYTDTTLLHALLEKIPALQPLIFNKHLVAILNTIDIDLFLTKSAFLHVMDTGKAAVDAWHQDTTINVKNQVNATGFEAWEHSNGHFKVTPPERILQNALIVRIHLEETFEENGALQVIPGSHKRKWKEHELTLIPINRTPVVAEVAAGGIHLMKPLVVHTEPTAPQQNRGPVIQLEFSSVGLPDGLLWAERHEIGIDLEPASD